MNIEVSRGHDRKGVGRVLGGVLGAVLGTVLGTVLVIVSGCGKHPAAVADPPTQHGCETDLCVFATLRSGEPTLDVEMVLSSKLAGQVHLPFYPEPFEKAPGGYGDFVSMGAEPMLEGLEVPAAGTVLTYSVRLEHHLAQPRHDLDAVPHPTRNGWFLVGRAFLPVFKLDGERIEPDTSLILDVDSSWEVASSAPTEGEEPRSLDNFRDAFYYVGRFHQTTVRHGDARVDLVTGDWPESILEPLKTIVRSVHGYLEAELGPLRASRRLLIYDRLPKGFAGGVVGRGIAVLSSVPQEVDVANPGGGILVHELTHQWLAGDDYWMSEGFTTYYQHLAQAKLSGGGEREALRTLTATMREYLELRPEHTLREARDRRAYVGGASLAFCLDTELHHAGTTLAATLTAHRETQQLGRVNASAYLAQLNTEHSDIAHRVNQWLDEPGTIDVEGCLRRAGYAVEHVSYTGYSLRALALEILKSASFSVQRAELFETLPGSVFQPGDILVEVDGQRVDRVQSLSWLLRHVEVGDALHVIVRRGPARVEVVFPMPAVDAAQRPEGSLLKATATQSGSRHSPLGGLGGG